MIIKCDIKRSSSEVFLLYRVQYELVTIFNKVPSQYMRVFVIWNLFLCLFTRILPSGFDV